jgi:hypothetical protein
MTFSALMHSREKRAKLLAQGLCGYCGKPNDRLPLPECTVCQKRSRVSVRRWKKTRGK